MKKMSRKDFIKLGIVGGLAKVIMPSPAQAASPKYFDSPQQLIERYEGKLHVFDLSYGACLDVAVYIQRDSFKAGYITSIVVSDHHYYWIRYVTHTNRWHALIQMQDTQGTYWTIDPTDWKITKLWEARDFSYLH